MSYREPARFLTSAEDLINYCLEQGKLIGIFRTSMLEAMKTFLIQNSPSSISPTPNFTHDKTKDGWKLVEDVTEAMEFKIKDLQLVSFLKKGEDYINGEEMVRRAKEMKCNFGQTTAEHLLVHQDQIPKEFRKYYLVFPGTVWQDPGGHRCVPYLFWIGDRWSLNFSCLGDGWDGNGRLLRASS